MKKQLGLVVLGRTLLLAGALFLGGLRTTYSPVRNGY